MKKLFLSRTFNYCLYVLIIAGFCYFTYYSAKSIEYNWRWNLIPQYVMNKVDMKYEAPASGNVVKDGEAIFIKTADGKMVHVADGVKIVVEDGAYVNTRDLVAVQQGWQTGPFIKGLYMTLEISAKSIIFAILIGIIAGFMRISPIYALRKLSVTYVELVRGTPLLVQLFLVYFFFGKVFNLSDITAGVVALSAFTGAYIAEIVRAGVQSVHKGQVEAAKSLGMGYFRTMWHIVLPQAMRRSLPPMAGQFISLIKDSSLVSAIGITDLTKAGREVISASYGVFEVWITIAAMYLLLTAVLSFVISRLEIHMARAEY